MSDFWYRLRGGRCSIGIASTKPTRFLPAFVNSATVNEKSWIICRSLKALISLRDSYAASVRKERLFSQSTESLQETTTFNLSD